MTALFTELTLNEQLGTSVALGVPGLQERLKMLLLCMNWSAVMTHTHKSPREIEQ